MKNINQELTLNYISMLKKKNLPKENIDGLSATFNFWLDTIDYVYKTSKRKKLNTKFIDSNQNNLFTFVFNKEKNLQSHHVMIKKNNISKPFIYFFKFLNNFILWDIFGKKKKVFNVVFIF